MSTRILRLAAAALVLGLVAVAAPARADMVTVTMPLSNQAVTVPTSGFVTLDFMGTVTIPVGQTFLNASVSNAFDSHGDSLVATLSALDLSAANNGGTVTGLLFTVEVDSTSVPGFYNLNPSTSFPVYAVNASIPTGGSEGSGHSYTIQVNGNAVPEPSTLALTAAGAGLAALILRRRRASGR